MEKKCLSCEEKIVGRADKKFCSDYCRNTYNNALKTDEKKIARPTNQQLWKNRELLKAKNPTGKSKVKRGVLVKAGFDFSLMTSLYTTSKGSQYRYCYDQGYLFDEKSDWVLLVEKKEYV